LSLVKEIYVEGDKSQRMSPVGGRRGVCLTRSAEQDIGIRYMDIAVRGRLEQVVTI